MTRIDICDLLDAMQARCDAAPPSPWRYRVAAYGDPANGPDHTVLEALYAEEWSVIARGDYDPWSGYGLGFAADARSDLPRLIAAVRAVLEVHRPGDGASQGFTVDGYGYIEPYCVGCEASDEYAVEWPCPTVTAIRTALIGDNND